MFERLPLGITQHTWVVPCVACVAVLSLSDWTDSYLNLLGLIENAKWNLRTIARAGKVATKSAKVHNSSDSTTQSCPEVVSEMSNGNISVHKQHDLFEIVSFRPDNFVQSTHRYSEQYDTIMW
jgi:hypothetical protein